MSAQQLQQHKSVHIVFSSRQDSYRLEKMEWACLFCLLLANETDHVR